MARPLRLEFPGSVHHVTSRGNGRQIIFVNDHDRGMFIELLGKCVKRFDWILTAYVMMSNHFHLLVQLTSENLSRGMQWLNGNYSQFFNRAHDRIGHVLQGRPDMRLIDHETYLLQVLRYVVLNPVRAKIVSRPEDYDWSSHAAVLGIAPSPEWLAVDDVLVQFAPDRTVARALYREFVESAIGSTDSPWSNLIGQMYLGSDAWLNRVRESVELKPRSSDFPREQRFVGTAAMADVIRHVAEAFSVDENQIRYGRGGFPRIAAAWFAWYEAQLTASEIAAGLRVRSCGSVARLVDRCERELGKYAALRDAIDRARSTFCRKKAQLKL